MNGIVMPMASRGSVVRLKRRIGFLMEGKTWSPCGRKFVAGGIFLALVAGVGVSQLGCRSTTSDGAMVGAVIGGGETLFGENVDESTEEPLAVRNRILFYGKFVIAREPIAANGAVISDENRITLLERLATTPGCEIHEMPVMSSENGKECVTEGTRELTDPSPRATAAFDDPAYRFTGVRFFTLPVVSGKDVILSCRAAYGRYPGMKWPVGETPHGDRKMIDRLRISTVTTRARLAAGQWMCVNFGEFEPGRFGALLIQPVPEDAAGLRVPDFSNQPPLLVQVRAWLLDGDELLGDKENPGTISSTFDSAEIEKIRKTTKGQITDLPTVTFASNRSPGQLWKALTHFRLTVSTRDGEISGESYRSSFVTFGGSHYKGKTTALGVPNIDEKGTRILFFKVDPQP